MSDRLSGFVRRHARLFVLSGAGISTASGIPDYRDQDGRWKRSPPVNGPDFVRSAAVRRRYWARSMIGWPAIANARPNPAHRALAQLQSADRIHRLVTQNVDGLHQRAGSQNVIELHGSIAQVVCLDCKLRLERSDVQRWLEAANPSRVGQRAASAPDGDADVDPAAWDDFAAPDCPHCGGMLKPNVVFFGDSVPRERVGEAVEALQQADAMLVVGSSLMLYSGYRFCDLARHLQKPMAAINLGRTRADHLFQVKVERPCTEALVDLARWLDS
jgi:NAD-dependent SIR2 family protein deacetylase